MGTATRRVALAVVAVTALVSTACGNSSGDRLRGAQLHVLAVWTGTEQQRFEAVLQRFEQATGVDVRYEAAGHRMADALDERRRAGDLPDLAMVPQPGLLQDDVRRGLLVTADPAVVAEVARNYAPVWRELGSVDGRLYGVWFKAADKSLVWYDVGRFERAGVVPPADLDGLLRIARTLAASGVAPFAVGGRDSWTLTDWFENLYLRLAGPDRYGQLAAHRIPWTDPSVKTTLRRMADLLAPGLVAGGAAHAASTTFEDSVREAFGPASAAAMVVEGDFVAGTVSATTTARPGVDVDVFPFPAGRAGPAAEAPVVGGGDAAVLFRSSPAGQALLRFLATPEAAAVWAGQGGFISPNLNLDLAVYPDELTRRVARSVLDAGDDFRFDLSDLQPAAFGSTPDAGMRKLLRDFLLDRDVDGTAAALEASAAAAYGR